MLIFRPAFPKKISPAEVRTSPHRLYVRDVFFLLTILKLEEGTCSVARAAGKCREKQIFCKCKFPLAIISACRYNKA